MKTHRPYPMAFITPKGERACRAGHPWVYDAEVERIVEAGDPKEAARTWKESNQINRALAHPARTE